MPRLVAASWMLWMALLPACGGEEPVDTTVDSPVDTETPGETDSPVDTDVAPSATTVTAAATSGGGSATGGSYRLTVSIGDPVSGQIRSNEAYQLTLGVGSLMLPKETP